MLDELAAGAAGAMTGLGHPDGLRRADGLGRARLPRGTRPLAPWLPLGGLPAQPGVGLALRKEMLRRRGLATEAAVRPPAGALPAALAALVDDHLTALSSL